MLRSQWILAVATRARKVEIVDGAAALSMPGLHGGAEQLVGGGRISANSVLPPASGTISEYIMVACPVRSFQEPSVSRCRPSSIRVLAARITVLVQVGRRVDFRVLFVAVIMAEHVDLHLAEIAGESDLCCRRQIDIVEQDQLIVKKGFVEAWRTSLAIPLPPASLTGDRTAAERWMKRLRP